MQNHHIISSLLNLVYCCVPTAVTGLLLLPLLPPSTSSSLSVTVIVAIAVAIVIIIITIAIAIAITVAFAFAVVTNVHFEEEQYWW